MKIYMENENGEYSDKAKPIWLTFEKKNRPMIEKLIKLGFSPVELEVMFMTSVYFMIAEENTLNQFNKLNEEKLNNINSNRLFTHDGIFTNFGNKTDIEFRELSKSFINKKIKEGCSPLELKSLLMSSVLHGVQFAHSNKRSEDHKKKLKKKS